MRPNAWGWMFAALVGGWVAGCGGTVVGTEDDETDAESSEPSVPGADGGDARSSKPSVPGKDAKDGRSSQPEASPEDAPVEAIEPADTAPTPQRLRGSIFLQAAAGADAAQDIQAVFLKDSAEDYRQACTQVVDGSCVFRQCSHGPTDQVYVPAGTLTASVQGQSTTLLRASDNRYDWTGGPLAWSAGQTIEISGSGSDAVPAFSSAITAVGDLVLLSPSIPHALTLSPDQDFTVAWEPNDAGVVGVVFTPRVLSEYPMVFVTCQFEGGAGSGSVPASLMGPFSQAGVKEPAVGFTFSRSVTTQAGDWDITVAQQARVVTSTGGPIASLPVSFTNTLQASP